jgi:hypothetical protein
MKIAFPWMGFLLILSGCAVLFPDRSAPKSSTYQILSPDAPWHRLDLARDSEAIDTIKADLAYENPETGAIISLNSLCRKYTDATLENLTNNLVRGINNREVLRQENAEVDGAKALDTLFKGQVDNVDLHIRTVVLIKDKCTYDFIYVSIPKKEKNSGQAFEKFLASFRTD